jgi:hypothetical protein
MSCPICFEEKNQCTQHCENDTVCDECKINGIKSSEIKYLFCMICNIEFDITYLKSFTNPRDYKSYINPLFMKLEFERNKSTFPQYIEEISRERQNRQTSMKNEKFMKAQNNIFNIMHQSKNLKRHFNEINELNELDSYEQEKLKLIKLALENIEFIHDAVESISSGLSDITRIHLTQSNNKHQLDQLKSLMMEKKNDTFSCPINNCKGYVKDEQCVLCKIHVCEKCREIKGVNHLCNPENIKSISMILKDSKSCPQCKSLIYKIEGCNHMFCIKCNTGFDWRSGKIYNLTSSYGNPHFIEWKRKNGFEKTVNDCDATFNSRCEALRNLRYIAMRQQVNQVESILMSVMFSIVLSSHESEDISFNSSIIESFKIKIQRENDFKNLTVNYLQGCIEEDKYKAKLFQRKYQVQVIKKSLSIFESFTDCALTILENSQLTISNYIESVLVKFKENKSFYTYFTANLPMLFNLRLEKRKHEKLFEFIESVQENAMKIRANNDKQFCELKNIFQEEFNKHSLITGQLKYTIFNNIWIAKDTKINNDTSIRRKIENDENIKRILRQFNVPMINNSLIFIN